jgi:hypothetical protein
LGRELNLIPSKVKVEILPARTGFLTNPFGAFAENTIRFGALQRTLNLDSSAFVLTDKDVFARRFLKMNMLLAITILTG